MGEAVLKDIARERGIQLEVDSCGTAGYHVGEEPDERRVVHIISSPQIDFWFLQNRQNVPKGMQDVLSLIFNRPFPA